MIQFQIRTRISLAAVSNRLGSLGGDGGGGGIGIRLGGGVFDLSNGAGLSLATAPLNRSIGASSDAVGSKIGEVVTVVGLTGGAAGSAITSALGSVADGLGPGPFAAPCSPSFIRSRRLSASSAPHVVGEPPELPERLVLPVHDDDQHHRHGDDDADEQQDGYRRECFHGEGFAGRFRPAPRDGNASPLGAYAVSLYLA